MRCGGWWVTTGSYNITLYILINSSNNFFFITPSIKLLLFADVYFILTVLFQILDKIQNGILHTISDSSQCNSRSDNCHHSFSSFSFSEVGKILIKWSYNNIGTSIVVLLSRRLWTLYNFYCIWYPQFPICKALIWNKIYLCYWYSVTRHVQLLRLILSIWEENLIFIN